MPNKHEATFADDFLNAATKVVNAKRKATRERKAAEEALLLAQEQEERERKRQNSLAERRIREMTAKGSAKLNKELAPILNALVALPEKNGKKFRFLSNPRVTTEIDGTYTVRASLTYTFSTLASSIGKQVYVNSVYKNGAETDARFAKAREDLGQWVGNVAPERMRELKKVLGPQPKKPSR